jgi:hypothetical protein
LTGQATAIRAQLSRDRGSGAPGASALTAAELRLLPLLSTHLSFPQIAGEMFLFAPVKPQHWVVASFEHHTSPHGLPRPHIHSVALLRLTTAANTR